MAKRDYSTWAKEELVKEILALKKQKTYGLVWEQEKTKEDFDLFLNWEGEKTKEEFSPESKDKFPVLTEIKDKEITSNKDEPVNLLIEGDNYHSLAVLNFTHKSSIDVIYIDPPYNTGNNDFKYNDKFVDIEDGYRHSKWLSFMSKRLRLAKNLLSKNGIIFISIDDNEHAQLKLLCDDIFNENNFIGTITWEKRTKAQNTETAREMFQSKTEYILVYKKDANKIRFKLEVSGEKNYDLEDERGLYRLKLVEEMSSVGMRGRQTMIFSIEGIMPRNGYQWKIGKEQVERYKKRDDIVVIEGKVYFKMRPDDEINQTFLPFWSHFFDKDTYGTSEKGKSELTKILGSNGHEFETVKPINLIRKLLFHINKKNAIVLDFFAGSGTTGHAVLEMNKKDGGNRQFILCTNNEGKICTDICYPRIKKAIKGYTMGDDKKVELGGNLKYFKTDFVEAEQTDKNKRKLVDNCTEMLCIKENTFEKVKDAKKFKIFKNSKSYLGIIFDEEYIDEFVKEAEKINGKINVYVFSHDDSVPANEFKTIKNKITLCPIPETILKVYRKVFKND